jgi:hypothetical protein
MKKITKLGNKYNIIYLDYSIIQFSYTVPTFVLDEDEAVVGREEGEEVLDGGQVDVVHCRGDNTMRYIVEVMIQLTNVKVTV